MEEEFEVDPENLLRRGWSETAWMCPRGTRCINA